MSIFDKIRNLFTPGPQQTHGNEKQQPLQATFSLHTLTENEKLLCSQAQLSEEDGLLLKQLTKRPIEQLQFEQEYAQIEKPGAICSLASEANAKDIVLDHLDTFRKQGKYIFLSGIAHDGYKVGITGATADPYKLMIHAETNGLNYDIDTEVIIVQCKQWDSQFGIIPIGIGFDFCELQIVNKNIDYQKLAEEVYEFCPDVVDQGTGTVEVLAKEMERTGTIYLWWD